MTYRGGIVTGIVLTLLIGATVYSGWRLTCPTPSAAVTKPVLPASVPTVLQESQINTITLTAQALDKLGLTTATVERKKIRRTREYGGEVTVPPGQAMVVSAPISGVVKAPVDGMPQPGQAVRKGQVLLQLQPLLSPEGQVNIALARTEAEGQVKSARAQLDAAQIALDRAKRLLAGETGSQRAVDEAQAQHDLAQRALEAATARVEKLRQSGPGGAEQNPATPLNIAAPDAGLVRDVLAQDRQHVPSGAALFQIVSLARVWVRVPVYVGDLPGLDGAAGAAVASLGAEGHSPRLPAARATAPPSANPAAGTVDLFFEMDNRAAGYRTIGAGRFSTGALSSVRMRRPLRAAGGPPQAMDQDVVLAPAPDQRPVNNEIRLSESLRATTQPARATPATGPTTRPAAAGMVPLPLLCLAALLTGRRRTWRIAGRACLALGLAMLAMV